MSPLQAMERSYAALKELLREGAYPPGFRLEANRIADEIGVSMTPVRDALNRLVGEQLVEASSGEGFRVPRISVAGLRDLYEWHSALIVIAIRTTRDPPASPNDGIGASLAEVTADLFERIAATAPNRELRLTVRSTADRLHPFRLLEPLALAPIFGELEELSAFGRGLPQAVRRYHLRRMRVVTELLDLRDQGLPQSRL